MRSVGHWAGACIIPSKTTQLSNFTDGSTFDYTVWLPSKTTQLSNKNTIYLTRGDVWLPSKPTQLSNKGETFIFSPVSNKQKDSAYISGQELCSRIWTATKCKRFRVSVQDEFLVLTPAYDLEREERDYGQND